MLLELVLQHYLNNFWTITLIIFLYVFFIVLPFWPANVQFLHSRGRLFHFFHK